MKLFRNCIILWLLTAAFVFCASRCHGQMGLRSGTFVSVATQPASGAALPTPSDYVLWYSADTLIGNDGDAVTVWQDSSANGWGAIPAASGPIITNVVGIGRAVQFTDPATAAPLVVSNAAVGICSNVSGFSVVVVGKPGAPNGLYGNTAFQADTGLDNSIRMAVTDSGDAGQLGVRTRRLDTDAASVQYGTTTDVGNTNCVWVFIVDFQNRLMSMYTNGVYVTNRSGINASGGATSPTNSFAIRIGGAKAATEGSKWTMHELLAYSRALTSNEMRTITTYFNAKYPAIPNYMP